MRTKINTVLFSALVVTAFTSGCMRYSPDRVFEQNTSAEISEVGADGSQIVTNADYRAWGRGPGADGVYGTGDDDLIGYTRVIRGKTERLEAVSAFVGPGSDGFWFTGDDETVLLARKEETEAGEIWTFGSSIFVGISVVLDDILNPPSLRKLRTNFSMRTLINSSPLSRGRLNFGNVESYRLLDLASNNGGFQIESGNSYVTSDKVASRITRKKTANGIDIRFVRLPGQDGVWGTQDDIANELWRVVQSGTKFSIFQYTSPGQDRLLDTSDDPISYGIYLEYNADGEIVLEKHITNSGADAIPFNGDDLYLAIVERRYWTKDSKKFTSVHSRATDPYVNGLSLNSLESENTILYVHDANLVPDIWKGPSTVLQAEGGGPKFQLNYVSAATGGGEGADSIIELKSYFGSYVCFPTDLVTLEPCSELSALKTDAGLGGASNTSEQVQTIRRIAPDSWEVRLNDSPYEVGFNRKLVKIDRGGP